MHFKKNFVTLLHAGYKLNTECISIIDRGKPTGMFKLVSQLKYLHKTDGPTERLQLEQNNVIVAQIRQK